MLTSFAIGSIGLALLMLGWLSVQRAWSRAFPDACSDPDPLAGRIGCQGCNCTKSCRKGSTPGTRTGGRENP